MPEFAESVWGVGKHWVMIYRENITGWKNSIFSLDSKLIKLGRAINSCRKESITLNYVWDPGDRHASIPGHQTPRKTRSVHPLFALPFVSSGGFFNPLVGCDGQSIDYTGHTWMKNSKTYLFDIWSARNILTSTVLQTHPKTNWTFVILSQVSFRSSRLSSIGRVSA